MKKKELNKGYSLSDIAAALELTPVLPHAQRSVLGICPFDAPEIDHISFSSDQQVRRVRAQLELSTVAAVIVHETIDLSKLPNTFAYFKSPDPLRSLIKLVPLFYEAYPSSCSISSKASIHATAQIGKNVTIGDFDDL